MKSLFTLVLILITTTCYAQDSAWPNKTRVLPEVLRKIPEAIHIKHSPNPNYPELNRTENSKDPKYVWKHATSVSSLDQDLAVKAAGSFIWYSAEGWMTNIEYNRKQFAKNFNCPKGKLIKGETYTFVENYRFGNNLYGGDALWYVIAEDSAGNTYKGYSILETEAELQGK